MDRTEGWNRMESFQGGRGARRTVPAWAVVVFSALGLSQAQTYKYDFGTAGSSAAAGFVKITPEARYSSASGHGFEGSGVACQDKGGDALTGDFCTMSGEFLFSVKVPQGNYKLTVHLGDPSGTSETTVKAENRRLLFDRVTTASGQKASKTLTVNRREARSSDGTVTMSLKDRELTYLTWDDKLTLRFSGRKPAVAAVELVKVDDAITWFLCGNSTVVDQIDIGWASWGQYIPHFFKTGVSIANYAESGLTAGGFLSMRRLTKLLADSKPGDYVAVEFGHNDQKNSNDVNAYPNNLKIFADQIKAKGCIPVFVTPTARRGDNNPKTSIGGLAEVMRNQAKALGVALIDLNQMSLQVMEAYGPDAGKCYMDVSHFTDMGGYILARAVTKGVKDLNNTLTPFLQDNRPVFDPTKPDPINYLTLELDPETVAVRMHRKAGIGPLPDLMSAGRVQRGNGSVHSADGKKLGIGGEACCEISRRKR